MNNWALDEQEHKKGLKQRIALEFAVIPEDVARVAAFSGYNSGSYFKGATQVVDGGLMLNRSRGVN